MNRPPRLQTISNPAIRLAALYRWLFLALLGCAVPFGLMAQSELVINGQVQDIKQVPVPSASVRLQKQQKSVETDQNGRFSLQINSSGLDSVTFLVTAIGYKPKEVRVPAAGASSDLTIVLEEQSAVQTIDIVVNAIRGEEKAPISQTTLSKEDIDKQFYGQDATALLQQTPNINASFDAGNLFSNYSYMRIRGLDYSRINVTLDGVPLNDMMDQGVFFSNMVDFANSIQSVQVQRGVGTSSNGTAGYAGSVNFESLRPQDQLPGAELQLSVGSFGTSRYSAEVYSGLVKGWSFYGRYSALQSAGYRDNSGMQGNSFFGSAVYEDDKHLIKFTGFSGRNKNRLAYLPVPLYLIDQNPRTNLLTPGATDDFGQDLITAQYARKFDPRNTLSISAYFGSAGGWFEYSDLDILGLRNRHFGLISNYRHVSEDNKLLFIAGIQANTFLRENWYAQNPANDTRLYNNWGRKDEASAFAKLSYNLAGFDLFADLQVRYAGFGYTPDIKENISVGSQSWTFLNPKVGVSYPITERVSAFASVGMVGREPTRSDLLNGTDNITVANKDTTAQFGNLKPESLLDYEAGINLKYSWLRGQINAFYMDFRNEIAATGAYTSWFVPLRKNVNSSYRTGLEWSLNAKATDWLSIQSTGAYTVAKIRSYTNDAEGKTYDNVTPLLTPTWILSNGLILSPTKWLDLALIGRYVSKSYLANNDDENLSMPGYFVVDSRLSVNYQRKYSLSVLVNNLTNQRYFNNGAIGYDAAGNTTPAYVVQAPINLFVTVSARF